MSDVEQEQIVEEVVVEEQSGAITIEDALKVVLRTSLVHDGLARGLEKLLKLYLKEKLNYVFCVTLLLKNQSSNWLKLYVMNQKKNPID